MNRLQLPVLAISLAILLSTHIRANAQDVHSLRLKIDEAASRLDSARRSLPGDHHARLSARVDELRRQLTEFESLEADLESRQQKIDDARFRQQQEKRDLQITRRRLEKEKTDLAALNETYDGDVREHNIKVECHNSSPPSPYDHRAVDEYNSERDRQNQRAQTLDERREAGIQQMESLFHRVVEQEDEERELTESLDELKKLITRQWQSMTSFEEDVQQAIARANDLIAAIAQVKAGQQRRSGLQSPIPAEYQRGRTLPRSDAPAVGAEGYVPLANQPNIGKAGALNGEVWVEDVFGRRHRISNGDGIYHESRLITGSSGNLQIMLNDETIFTIGPDSEIVMDDYVYDPETKSGSIRARVDKGIFRFVTGKLARKRKKKFDVKIPVGTIGIRGTDYVVEVSESGKSKIGVLSGAIVFQPNGSTEETWVHPGEQIEVSPDEVVSRCESSDAGEKAGTLLPMPPRRKSFADTPVPLHWIVLIGIAFFVSCGGLWPKINAAYVAWPRAPSKR